MNMSPKFLKIDGAKGVSDQPSHEGDFSVLQFSLRRDSVPFQTSSGSQLYNVLYIQRYWDGGSEEIRKLNGKNEKHKYTLVSYNHDDKKELTIEITDGLCRDFDGGLGQGQPESFSVYFREGTYSVETYDPSSGKIGSPIRTDIGVKKASVT